MKKINLVLAGIAVILCLAACNKKGDCVCKTIINGEEMQSVTTPDVDEDACKALNVNQNVQGMTSETKCTFNG